MTQVAWLVELADITARDIQVDLGPYSPSHNRIYVMSRVVGKVSPQTAFITMSRSFENIIVSFVIVVSTHLSQFWLQVRSM
jgi:hypothetical protein